LLECPLTTRITKHIVNESVPFGMGQGTFEYVRKADDPADQPTSDPPTKFTNSCNDIKRSGDLLSSHNPTCDARTYAGGQLACHHMQALLDHDQDIPWADQPLTYHLKFRFWVQPYDATYHTALRRSTWGIASPVEYDVPKCADGVPGCSRGADGTWVHTIKGSYKGGGRLAAAHFHCHAPSCLSIAMYRCNSSVAECTAETGELLCEERTVFGGSGHSDAKFDEPGYILQPPCIWGKLEHGLTEPPQTDGYTLHSVKTSNASYGHHGEMAWQQMYVF